MNIRTLLTDDNRYYCFEYVVLYLKHVALRLARFVWQAKGLSLNERVKYLENRWAYFLGFGELL